MSSLRRRRRRPAQSLVEVALLLPISVGLLYLVFGLWLHFARVSAYTRAANVLSEWIARTGTYDASIMCAATRQTLLDQVGAGVVLDCSGSGESNTFLQIVVLSPECVASSSACPAAQLTTVGGPFTGVPDPDEANCSGSNPSACPAEGIGWTEDVGSSEDRIEPGSRVIVDIWGSRKAGGLIFSANSTMWLMPVGHSVAQVTGEQYL